MFSSFKKASMPTPQPEPALEVEPAPPTAEQIAEALIEKHRTIMALQALRQQADDRRSQVESLAKQAAAIETAHGQLEQQITAREAEVARIDAQISGDKKRLETEINSDLKRAAAKADRINALRDELAALVKEFSNDAVNIREKWQQLHSPSSIEQIPTIANLEAPFAHRNSPTHIWKNELPHATVNLTRRLITLRTVANQQTVDRNHEERMRQSRAV